MSENQSKRLSRTQTGKEKGGRRKGCETVETCLQLGIDTYHCNGRRDSSSRTDTACEFRGQVSSKGREENRRENGETRSHHKHLVAQQWSRKSSLSHQPAGGSKKERVQLKGDRLASERETRSCLVTVGRAVVTNGHAGKDRRCSTLSH